MEPVNEWGLRIIPLLYGVYTLTRLSCTMFRGLHSREEIRKFFVGQSVYLMLAITGIAMDILYLLEGLVTVTVLGFNVCQIANSMCQMSISFNRLPKRMMKTKHLLFSRGVYIVAQIVNVASIGFSLFAGIFNNSDWLNNTANGVGVAGVVTYLVTEANTLIASRILLHYLPTNEDATVINLESANITRLILQNLAYANTCCCIAGIFSAILYYQPYYVFLVFLIIATSESYLAYAGVFYFAQMLKRLNARGGSSQAKLVDNNVTSIENKVSSGSTVHDV